MEKDKLKSFVQEHRSEFDAQVAPSGLWDKIEAKLPPKPPKNGPFRIILLGSIITMALLVGYFFSSYQNDDQNVDIQFAETAPTEFLEMESYYQRILNDKRSQYMQASYNSNLNNELFDLDKGYQELKHDLLHSNTNNEEFMMHLMIENYQLRIKLLEMRLNQDQHFKTKIKDYEQNEY